MTHNIAGVMLIIKDGLILSISRRDDTSVFGLPGGKMEVSDASPMEAAVRETQEETSVTVKDCDFIYLREEPPREPGGKTFNTYCYFAKDWTGIPQSSEEGQIAWLSKEELTLTKAAFPDYNRKTLEAFTKKYPLIPIKEKQS